MALLYESVMLQDRDTWLNRKWFILLKLILLIVNIAIIVLDNPYIILLFTIVYVVFYASIRALKLVYSALLMYIPPISAIAFLTYLVGNLSMHHLNLYIYGFSLILSILLIFSTSKREDLLRLLSKIRLDIAYSLTLNIFEELRQMVDSKIARGWEPGFNPFKYYVIIIDAIKLTIIRLQEVEEALRARGIE
ncbi:hypothetical protein [Desulfurococcus amylolyticus]|uniref:Cobalt transport protein n=1 Tax=Desulfurococcus amylolyticus DSM 16532 TaxID=768672 RepID=I3XQK2_DESAM|nr:hypothetical protein [Desulfurococcus amylolyticus]AFL66226.1 hypothetical protein Desfe_0316 [Desulfurococcus amylolyticus DSM 16532]